MVKKLVMLMGVALLVFGVLGFVPAAMSSGLLLGIFEVGATLSSIYLVSGLLAIMFAAQGKYEAKSFAKIFGVLYGFVAVVGFVYETSVLDYFPVNAAVNWLHVGFALVLTALGFFGAGAGNDMRHRSQKGLVRSGSGGDGS